jgi:glutamate 5-kinase
VICDGTRPGSLVDAAGGEEVGTRFAAQAGRSSSFKLWLKYAKPARGRVTVDGGAARVLRESGSSLLPVGITAVEGEFEAGDAVEVAIDGSVLGKGIVEYSARELGQVRGLKSDTIREQLPHSADEAIHRDRFVLL